MLHRSRGASPFSNLFDESVMRDCSTCPPSLCAPDRVESDVYCRTPSLEAIGR